MPRPTPLHQPGNAPLVGETPPPLGRRDPPDPWYGKYILFPLFLLVLFAVPAAWVFRYQIMRAMLTPDQRTWPTVMATVTSTRLETSGHFELSRAHPYSDDSRCRYRGYVPEVDFTFVVGNQTYTGSTLAYLPRVYVGESDAQRTLDKYPEKSQLLIHYNPQDPFDNIVDQARTDLVGTWSDSSRW